MSNLILKNLFKWNRTRTADIGVHWKRYALKKF